jgi:AraC family transcriptional regulator of arabinose operon
MPRPITPHHAVDQLIAGEFQQDATYDNWRPQGSGDWLLIHTLAGAGRFAAGGQDHSLLPGEALLFAPPAAQDYGTDAATGHWHLLWTHFHPRPAWRALLRWPEVARSVARLRIPEGEVRSHFETALRRMLAATRRPGPAAPDLAANALEEALLWARAVLDGDPWVRIDSRVRRAMNYLAENITAPFALRGLAAHCGLSVSRLSHLFREQTGISPQRHAEELRLTHARQLLRHTNLRVSEIAAATGFGDPFYFSKRFRRATGTSPRAFRQAAFAPRSAAC